MSINKLSNRHQAILNFMISNPGAKMGDIAGEFNLTRCWLSCVIHSMAFKAALAEAQETVFNEVTLPLREKLEGVAHRAVEKLGEKIDDAQDAKFILDVADKTLHRLGFAPNKGPELGAPIQAQQNNFYIVDKNSLEAARNGMKQIREGLEAPALQPALEHQAENTLLESNALSAAEEV